MHGHRLPQGALPLLPPRDVEFHRDKAGPQNGTLMPTITRLLTIPCPISTPST
jgi:hypothetical protein